MRTLAFRLALISTLVAAELEAIETQTVSTPQGDVMGRVTPYGVEFLNIPFASACVRECALLCRAMAQLALYTHRSVQPCCFKRTHSRSPFELRASFVGLRAFAFVFRSARLQPPQPHAPWAPNTLNATAYGPPCPQVCLLPSCPGSVVGVEDCLNLNMCASKVTESGVRKLLRLIRKKDTLQDYLVAGCVASSLTTLLSQKDTCLLAPPTRRNCQ